MNTNALIESKPCESFGVMEEVDGMNKPKVVCVDEIVNELLSVLAKHDLSYSQAVDLLDCAKDELKHIPLWRK